MARGWYRIGRCSTAAACMTILMSGIIGGLQRRELVLHLQTRQPRLR
jgi:hypothetical protein